MVLPDTVPFNVLVALADVWLKESVMLEVAVPPLLAAAAPWAVALALPLELLLLLFLLTVLVEVEVDVSVLVSVLVELSVLVCVAVEYSLAAGPEFLVWSDVAVADCGPVTAAAPPAPGLMPSVSAGAVELLLPVPVVVLLMTGFAMAWPARPKATAIADANRVFFIVFPLNRFRGGD